MSEVHSAAAMHFVHAPKAAWLPYYCFKSAAAGSSSAMYLRYGGLNHGLGHLFVLLVSELMFPSQLKPSCSCADFLTRPADINHCRRSVVLDISDPATVLAVLAAVIQANRSWQQCRSHASAHSLPYRLSASAMARSWPGHCLLLVFELLSQANSQSVS